MSDAARQCETLPQERLIERVRHLCHSDQRVRAAVMYGSFARGEGDAYSDIEFALFFRDEALPELDRRQWVEQIAPLALFFADDFGHLTAIFGDLTRGEFHFEPASRMDVVRTWQGSAYFRSLADCLLLDRTGDMAPLLAPLLTQPDRGSTDEVLRLEANLANTILFGANVLARGEIARALEVLTLVQRYLLFLARLVEGKTEHWPTPSRCLERELSPAAYARYATCTAPLDAAALRQAYTNAWRWGGELMATLAPAHGHGVPDDLWQRLGERVQATAPADAAGR